MVTAEVLKASGGPRFLNRSLPRQSMAFFLLLRFVAPLDAAEQFELSEIADDARVFRVAAAVNATGQLETALGGGKAVGLKLKVDGRFNFLQRRLTGAGRDAESLRTVRFYDRAQATITVNGDSSISRLSELNRLIVAHGKREGLLLYSHSGPLTYDELELLRMPGDCLAILALLPNKKVSVGQKWNPDRWVIQMLTGVEAVLSDKLTCHFESAEAQVAKVTFLGEIEGASLGAATTVEVSGHYLFDLKAQHISHVKLTQHEKRSVGTVSPGMDVSAQVILDRASTHRGGPLSDAIVEEIPLEPNPKLLQLRFDSPWNIHFTYGREWHIFHQTRDVAVLRLLERGSLVAQCNISPVPSVSPGQHTPKKQFEADVRVALRNKLRAISNPRERRTKNQQFLLQLTAEGESNGRSMQWHYHLCTSSEGQQVALVFAMETQMVERLGNREMRLIDELHFLTNPLTKNSKR